MPYSRRSPAYPFHKLRSAASSSSRSAPKRPAPRPWKENAKTVETTDGPKRKQARLSTRAMKDGGADLLYHSGNPDLQKLGVRVSHCCQVPHGQSPVNLMQGEGGAAYFSGLKRCSSVWACPVCSNRVSTARRDDLNLLLERARAAGFSPVLITLTARHTKGDKLPDLLAAMKAAKKRWQQLQAYRALKSLGLSSVTATEVTHGDNGWHVHYHLIAILKTDPAAALAAAETLRPAWLKALSAYGLSGNHAAFRADPGHLAGDYVSKWNAASELALGDRKSGRQGSRNPWQLLRASAEGDKRAALLWLDFVHAFKGVRQLVWSRGLRAEFGIGDEVADADVPDPAETASPVVLRSWSCDVLTGWSRWRSARRRYSSLLTAAESGESLDAAEFGETDRALWDKYLSDAAVIEGME